MHTYSFEKLEVWQNARKFVRDIYKVTRNSLKKKNLELRIKSVALRPVSLQI